MDEKGHLQATGLDDRGRKQYHYHPNWSTFTNAIKFDQLVDFGRVLPKVRRRVRRHLTGPITDINTALAGLVTVLDEGQMRVGKFSALMHEDFFQRDAVAVASDLLGATLLVNGVGGVIVETEAYRQDDEASHSYRGKTLANAAMFGEAARAYVYRSYGLHWCLNFVCDTGSAVLVRALEPTHAVDTMMAQRRTDNRYKLCAGPGNVCKALSVTGEMNGLSILKPPFSLALARIPAPTVTGARVGITKAVERRWRFAVQGSRYLSKPI